MKKMSDSSIIFIEFFKKRDMRTSQQDNTKIKKEEAIDLVKETESSEDQVDETTDEAKDEDVKETSDETKSDESLE